MKIKNLTTEQKLYAESKRAMLNKKSIHSKHSLLSEKGGGLGVVFIGLAIIVVVLLIFINIADYSIYTYKRNALTKAMDYAVTAAAQEIDIESSLTGISNGFSENSGESLLDGVEININQARDVFQNMFYKNISISDFNINDRLLICTTVAKNSRLKYKILTGENPLIQGTVDVPSEMEECINDSVEEIWTEENSANIFVIGNPATNQIEKGTYLLAVVNNMEINGLISKRKVSLSCFAGAKVERLTDD